MCRQAVLGSPQPAGWQRNNVVGEHQISVPEHPAVLIKARNMGSPVIDARLLLFVPDALLAAAQTFLNLHKQTASTKTRAAFGRFCP